MFVCASFKADHGQCYLIPGGFGTWYRCRYGSYPDMHCGGHLCCSCVYSTVGSLIYPIYVGTYTYKKCLFVCLCKSKRGLLGRHFDKCTLFGVGTPDWQCQHWSWHIGSVNMLHGFFCYNKQGWPWHIATSPREGSFCKFVRDRCLWKIDIKMWDSVNIRYLF